MAHHALSKAPYSVVVTNTGVVTGVTPCGNLTNAEHVFRKLIEHLGGIATEDDLDIGYCEIGERTVYYVTNVCVDDLKELN
jgi:hypothetical protein